MIRHMPRARAGITLTEILIAILIMGVGLVSLATLFPLGLLRLREAARYNRSTLLGETAANDMGTRNLLQPESFTFSWYFTFPGSPATPYGLNPRNNPYTPWSHDNPFTGQATPVVFRNTGPGLPVAYDPLWWSVIHQQTLSAPDPNLGVINPLTVEARFGTGTAFLRPDPDGLGFPSAYGLQRITNFAPVPNAPYTLPLSSDWPFVYPNPAAATLPTNNPLYYASLLPDTTADIFTSRDDIVMQSSEGGEPNANTALGVGSPVVPQLTKNPQTGALVYQNDWAYSWMFTGYQSEVNDSTAFEGDVVVFHNRPFGIETVSSPYGGAVTIPTGERVVEAQFGMLPANDHTAVLRWPASLPDPDIKVGSWLADVTYERVAAISTARWGGQPAQRCYWYQVAKRQQATVSPVFSTDGGVPYRQMTLTLTTAVRTRTPLNVNTGEPLHVNAALLNPYVVNVFPRTIYVRP